jgi:hypothetical protein
VKHKKYKNDQIVVVDTEEVEIPREPTEKDIRASGKTNVLACIGEKGG